jgi:tetratricopeptide (TPR) repeat protein
MHSRLTLFIIIFVSFCHLNGEETDSTKSYLWRLIQFSFDQDIEYEPGYRKDRILHRREFHEPIKFLPAEVRYGVFYHGGVGTDGKSIKSDWMRYEDAVSSFDGGTITARFGHQLDIDFVKTNLFYTFLRASWLDMQTGLNFRYSNLLVPGKIEQISSWGNEQSSWNPGYIRFAPRILSLGLSHTAMLQWFETWYIDMRYTWGYSFSNFYMNKNDDLFSNLSGVGPAMSISIGPRFIIDLGMKYGDEKGKKTRLRHNRFSFGLDFRYAYTKLNSINDPDDITPIKKIHLQDFGIHLTFSVIYGGMLTSGDQGKDHYYRGDFITANDYFETFLVNYPDHTNRKKAEKYLAECKKKIPIQLFKEGLEFERKGMFDKAIDRFISGRLKADGETRKLIQDKLEHIAILEIEKADLLSAQGSADEAVAMMEKIKHFSTAARDKIPIYKARQILQEGEKALHFGFYSKSLTLFDEALHKDSSLKFEVSTLRYQVATHLVEMANKISDHSELRAAIQLLVDASEMTGGLGEKNEKVLNELLIKFNSDQDREMTSRIDQRMDVFRQRAIIKESTSSLIVGMTIPDIQSLLGQPKDIIQKKDKEGSSIQLWIYPLEDGGEMYLSFKDYILFKIEKDA